jgi:large subunit ribosomal protein L17
MRHRKAGLKLNRTPSHRNAMFRNMVTSLFKYDRIRTTGTKAMELRRWADHIITLAKRGDLHARRQALAIVREKDVVHKLFENAAARFGDISGGYTRVVKLGRRPGDAAPISLIELVVLQDTKKKKTKKKKTKTEAAPKKTAADKKVADKGEEKPEKVAEKKAVPAENEDESGLEAAKSVAKNTEAATQEEAAIEGTTAAKAVPEEKAAAEIEDASDTKDK